MDVGPSFVADAQAPVLVQPADRALDDPSLGAEPGAVLALRPGDLRLDVAAAQLAASLARVVGAVAIQRPWSAARSAAAAAHRRDRVKQRHQLSDVVAVAAGESGGERRSPAAGDYVML
jgi:hypothetical protein